MIKTDTILNEISKKENSIIIDGPNELMIIQITLTNISHIIKISQG